MNTLVIPFTSSVTQLSILLSHPISLSLTLYAANTPTQWLAAYKGNGTLLAAPLPANVHLTTVHAHNATNFLLRLTHS